MATKRKVRLTLTAELRESLDRIHEVNLRANAVRYLGDTLRMALARGLRVLEWEIGSDPAAPRVASPPAAKEGRA